MSRSPARNAFPFVAQALRALATLGLVPTAAQLWDTSFVGQFFAAVAISFFISLLVDGGYSFAGYHLLSGAGQAKEKEVLGTIARRRLTHAALILLLAAITAFAVPGRRVLILATATYGISQALSLSFYFNIKKNGLRFVASECLPPITLLFAPFLTLFHVEPAAAFLIGSLLSAGAMLSLMLNVTGLSGIEGAGVATGAWSVAISRMVIYCFTLASTPVATFLFGTKAAASIALADRTNGAIALLIVPLGNVLASDTALAGQGALGKSAKRVFGVAAYYGLAWSLYAAVLASLFDWIAPIMFGSTTHVPLSYALTFAFAALFSGFNTFILSGFVTPLGHFKSTLTCACVGALSFATAVLAGRGVGPMSVPFARLSSEAAVFCVATGVAIAIVRRSRAARA